MSALKFTVLIPPGPLRVIEGPTPSKEILENLERGIEKHLTVLYRPFSGNKIYFYNEKLQQILDIVSLYSALEIIVTNQERYCNESLEGIFSVNQTVKLFGPGRRLNMITVQCAGNKYRIRDEWDLNIFSRETLNSIISVYVN